MTTLHLHVLGTQSLAVLIESDWCCVTGLSGLALVVPWVGVESQSRGAFKGVGID